jgi:hypothetical protein
MSWIKKLNYGEVKEQDQVKIALEDLDGNGKISRY